MCLPRMLIYYKSNETTKINVSGFILYEESHEAKWTFEYYLWTETDVHMWYVHVHVWLIVLTAGLIESS